MSTAAVHSHGTTFNWDGADIAELDTINGIEITMTSVDATNHQSPDHFTESIPGMLTAGDVTLTGNYIASDTTGQQAMLTDMLARSVKTGIITFPTSTGTTWTLSGYPTAIKIGDAPVDGKIPFTATIHPTGKPTLATATVTGMSAIEFSNDVLIMPTFAIGTYGADKPYVVTITALETSTVVTPTDATGGEVITITTDGGSSQVVATTEASSPCILDVDDVTQIVVTITKTGYAPKSYYFNCVVLAS